MNARAIYIWHNSIVVKCGQICFLACGNLLHHITLHKSAHAELCQAAVQRGQADMVPELFQTADRHKEGSSMLWPVLFNKTSVISCHPALGVLSGIAAQWFAIMLLSLYTVIPLQVTIP